MIRRVAALGAAVLAAALLPTVAQETATAAVGEPRVVPLQVTGDAADRFSMVVMGDGYTEAELPEFRADVEKHLNVLWSIEPFRSYRNYVNVYLVEVPSADSGVDCDPDLTSPRRDTALGMGFWGGCNPSSVQRLLTVNNTLARQYATLATPDYDQILAIANSDTYGGAGGAYATASGGNALSALITPHELGHSLGGLQDEYTYYGRGVPGGRYTGGEPSSIHHTLLTEEQMLAQQRKWWRWLGEPSESGGVIGRYEGGQYFDSGIWRPSKHSMMISLGYYFDQVSRERMTQRISQRVNLIEDSTPTSAPVGRTDVLWVETAHPVHHDLDVTWSVDGTVIPDTQNSRDLDLETLALAPGSRVTATVVDPTAFVRDPAVRATMTATRAWTVGEATSPPGTTPLRFTSWTRTERPLGAQDVVHAETTHPVGSVPTVTWRLDGTVVPSPTKARSFDLGARAISPGRHTLTATVGAETLTWTVDSAPPTVGYEVSAPLTTFTAADGTAHHVFNEQFTMALRPTDDVEGYVVGEFRRDGDGWHHYYGWPDSPEGTPYHFTPRGTNIAGLVYGSLSPEGLSPQPWEERTPGYGTHLLEYRGIDAAGNIGGQGAFNVSVLPSTPACTSTVTGRVSTPLNVTSGVLCLRGARVSGPVTVGAGASLIADGAEIRGPVTASGAGTVQLTETLVSGSVTVDGATGGVSLLGAEVRGAVTLTGNNGTAFAPVVAGTTVKAQLQCASNAVAPVDLGVANTVNSRRTGQCASL
ncbi:M64 family metallopeptidase [Motilibacter aurantiacus]|uniref:M64 family metallopeptidase n=1 Tax=Motilibacter aurantiacus TaxID=2714955 RepID=UPI0014093F81|nr:M64 family metallopeptidase [Motilibacter aurantiacus]NHC44261.1 peptidase [Motilibacter aurantiacus]